MTRSKRTNLLFHIILLILSLIMIYPVVWWVFATFKPVSELSSNNLLPQAFTLENYIKGWISSSGMTFATYFRNSLILEAFCVTGSVLTSGFVAFGFARIKFPMRNLLFSILMLTLMLPSQVTVVSQFILYNKVGAVNTYVPLVLPYWLGGSAFFIYLVIQFIRGIPIELDEAATIDGAGIFRIYWQIIFPLIRTTLVTVGLLTFIWSWDDFYSHVLYLSSPQKFTVGLALRMFIDQFDVQWSQLLAMALLSVIPSVVLFFSAQKQFIAGIATTGLKG